VSIGIGFAIPSVIVHKVVPALIKTRTYKHPWLGISGMSLTSDLAGAMGLNPTQRGALVTDVLPGSPAAQAGVRGSDRDMLLEGEPVRLGGDVVVAILVAVGMFRGSGALTWFTSWMGPLTAPAGLPGEVLPQALVRPLSGSGALGLMSETLKTHGPDSYVGYVASTLQGCTDTTFYILAVYFGSVGVTRARHAVAAGLSADLAGVLATGAVCAALFGHLR
jgi:spore maturation protein SpmB